MLRHVSIAALLCFAAPSVLASPEAKLGAHLQAAMQSESRTFDVLIYLKAQANLTGARLLMDKADKGKFVYDALRHTALATQGPLKAWLSKEKVDFQPYYVANMIAAFGVTKEQVLEIAQRSEVARILPNPEVRVLEPATPEMLRHEESLAAVGDNIASTGAARVWEEFGARGEGIVVANQDTGLDWDHPALKNQYRGWNGLTASHDYNWHDAIRRGNGGSCGLASREPCDDHGHGTHTLGTSVGDDGRGNQIGMAPGAKWIGCRNMDRGTGRPSTYIECFEFFLAPYPYGGDPMMDGDPTKAPHVMNNSWGCPSNEGCSGEEFLPVLTALKEAGIMVVAAAGNAGSSCSTINDAPAHHTEETFAVGAIDHRSGNIASFSSRGPSRFDGGIGPDLAAPGVNIRSSIPGGGFSGTFWSGTSMASPHTVGAVALLWSLDPSLIGNVDQTAELLRATATPKTTSQSCGGRSGSQVPNNTYGHGILNVYSAAAARVSK